MKQIRLDTLTPSFRRDLLTLKEHCSAFGTVSFDPDETDPELSYYYYGIYRDDLLISALIVSLFADSDSPVFDFYAMTEPDDRRQGFFSDLFDTFLEDLEEDYPESVFFSDLFLESSSDTTEFLKNLGYEETSREYLMAISTNPHRTSSVTLEPTSDYERLSDCYHRIFGVTKEQADLAFENLKDFDTWYLIKNEDLLLGIVLLIRESQGLYLCNFGILPEYRRRGYAAKALQTIQNTLSENIFLQVSSANPAACALYQSYGFHITKELVAYHGEF